MVNTTSRSRSQAETLSSSSNYKAYIRAWDLEPGCYLSMPACVTSEVAIAGLEHEPPYDNIYNCTGQWPYTLNPLHLLRSTSSRLLQL